MGALLLGAATLTASAHAQDGDREPRFQGRMLVAVSDADMLPSAYIDGDLGPVAGEDALSVIRLDRPDGTYQVREVAASNSVAGPPASLAVTPDGRYAIVIETRGGRPAAGIAQTIGNLLPGRSITLVDLAEPDRPRVFQRIEGFTGPQSVAIDRTGTLVAIAHGQGSAGERSPPIVFYRLQAGRLSAAPVTTLPGWAAGDAAIDVEFHPREHVIAVVNATKPALSFFRYATAADGTITLTPWGNSLDIEKAPYLVRFTPDGRHVVTNGTYAARNFNIGDNASPRGTVSSFRVAASIGPDGAPRHRLVDRAETGVIPEGLNVSPDGRWIVTANLERSTPAPSDPTMRRYGSMSLIRLDPVSGRLTRVGDFAFDGALPETALFDNASHFIAVTVFSQFDAPSAKGSIDFWRIETDPVNDRRVELVKTRHSIPVMRGPHSMVIVR